MTTNGDTALSSYRTWLRPFKLPREPTDGDLAAGQEANKVLPPLHDGSLVSIISGEGQPPTGGSPHRRALPPCQHPIAWL